MYRQPGSGLPPGKGYTDDAALQAKFAPIAKELMQHESQIVAELNAAQGQPLDLGGYYQPDPARTTAAMRPSATFNRIISQLD